jgi:hypothetical protein
MSFLFRFLIVTALLLSAQAWALVSSGAYVPFGPSTQKSADGARNTFAFDPYLSLNGAFEIPFDHVFLPEVGLVFHGEGQDGYKKSTSFILLDVGYRIDQLWILRYGFGTFRTKISGDGGSVVLPNGNSTLAFARPSRSVTSLNTTFDLGIEYSANRNYAVRFQTFLFSAFNSESRKLSYALGMTYYL